MTTGYPSMPSHSTHPSLDGFHLPHHIPHGLPPHLQPTHSQGGQTCVPSLIPPGIDPATVDIRTFYPYQPNEVKHRKRTTRPQLKVLEGVYEHDTKPNALLRKKLAEELGMTPRGVQVWFQNRRAKEKNQAKKLDAGMSAPGTAGSGSSSTTVTGSSPSKADAATTSEGESSTASVSKDGSPENATTDVHNSSSPEIPSTSSSAETVRRTSLPTVPVVPALDSGSLADGSAVGNDVPSQGVPGPSYPAAHSVRGSNPTAAEILAQRRPSLPILNFPSSSHTLRRMPSNLSGRAPKGFDPNERRKSVDTMSANMQRLSAHPYARHVTQYTNASGHGQPGFGHGYPHSLNARRSISHSTGLSALEDSPEDLSAGLFASFATQQAANGRTAYYLSPPQPRGQNQPRPTLTQRTSMPSFHQSQQQQQLSPPSAATNGSFAGLPFTDPWGSPSQSQQSAPSVVDTPISPHALPPPSPGASAPPPISQSYSNPILTHSLSRRYPAGHGRPIPAPVPGPLPDAHFSFGLPASGPSSSGSSSSTSPVVNDNGLGLLGRGGAVLEEEDDASAVSSTYDPRSRFGSFASVASTESSWTSAHYSDVDRKLSVSAPDGFEEQRRGSIASGYLPQLFGEMDVNGGNTPQPMPDGVASDQSHPDHSRRGSSGSLHEQPEYSDAFAPQNVYDPNLQHEAYPPNDPSPYTQTPPQTESYVADNGSYSPSSTISARSQSVAGAKGINEHSHSVSPPMHQRSSTSELMYALHHSNPAESLNNTELTYTSEYNTSMANSSEHHLSTHQAHAQYDSLSSKADQYAQHQYPQQTDAYEMPQSHLQSAYSSPPMDYGYQMYQDPSLYHNGAVEIGSVCVPASMDTLNMGDYLAP